MPKNTSRVLHDTHIGSDVGFFILYDRHTFILNGLVKKLSKVIESCETPIAFLPSKSVRCHYR